MKTDTIIFRQLLDYESSTYTYILADPETMEGIIIDPVIEKAERDEKLIREIGITIKYILDTHVHADHITGAWKLKEHFPDAKIVVGKQNVWVQHNDIFLWDGDSLSFWNKKVHALETPGHTNGCMSYIVEDMIFTGDVLLIRGCGRTDFQQGSNKKMWESVRNKIFTYPDNTKIFPAHDYLWRMQSTVGEEKQYNQRLRIENSFQQFEDIMNNLNLPNPKKLAESLPANLMCWHKCG